MKFNSPEQRQKAVLLGGLYTSQMLGLTFIMTALPTILRQSGVGLDKIGWIFALGFCWSIKFLWAPLIDRYGSKKYGHYRSWILVLQMLMIVVTIGASFFSVTGQLFVLSLLSVLLAIFSATQDIAADGLAVTILEPEERGIGNSIQSAGNLIGLMIGGGVVLITYQWLGWRGCLLVLAGGMALPLISILHYKEKPAPADTRINKVDYKNLIRFFGRPRIWRWIPVLLISRISNMIVYGLLSPLLVDLGWSLERIGISINIVGTLFGIAGAVLGGSIVSRSGRKTAMLATMLFTILATIGLCGPARGIDDSVIVYVVIGLIMGSYGGSSAVIYTVIMDKSDPASAGTDFTLQMSISGISAFAAVGLAMVLAESIGYASVLIICTGVAILSMALIWFYDDFEPAQFSGA
jgi:MFS family permease